MGYTFVYFVLAICEIVAQETTTKYSTTISKLKLELLKLEDTPYDNNNASTTTDTEVPSKPRNLTVLDYTSNSIRLRWMNPEKKNSAIEGYRVYYIHNNFTEVWPDKIPYNDSLNIYNLTRLSKFFKKYCNACKLVFVALKTIHCFGNWFQFTVIKRQRMLIVCKVGDSFLTLGHFTLIYENIESKKYTVLF